MSICFSLICLSQFFIDPLANGGYFFIVNVVMVETKTLNKEQNIPTASQAFQVIPSDGNPQMRRALFDGYLFKYCSVKYQTFHQVSEKTSQQTHSHQKTENLKSFPDASKSHKISTNLSDRAYFRQFSDW